jgi:Cys-tRNA synthase (O-phospho-L-seryl-tRNA:Cys-tRNA synthase)
MTTEFWVGLLIALGTNIATLAAAWGSFTARLKALEQKVDKHNNLVERMYRCEGDIKLHDSQLKELKEKEN